MSRLLIWKKNQVHIINCISDFLKYSNSNIYKINSAFIFWILAGNILAILIPKDSSNKLLDLFLLFQNHKSSKNLVLYSGQYGISKNMNEY